MSEESKLSLNSSHFQPFALRFAEDQRAVVLDNKNGPESLSPIGNTIILNHIRVCISTHVHTCAHTHIHITVDVPPAAAKTSLKV